MKILGLAIILFCPLLAVQSAAQGELPDGYQYVFPSPGANYIHPNSTIILRFDNISPDELMNLGTLIKVSGETSGRQNGTTIVASDHRTVIFKSESAYKLGEQVKVSIDPQLSESNRKNINPLNYSFTVLKNEVTNKFNADQEEDQPTGQKKSAATGSPLIMPNGVSVPADFPHVIITQNSDPSSDYIFLNNWGPPYYNIIFNTSGEPVWYLKTPVRQDDFKVQINGWITMLDRDGRGGSDNSHMAFTEDFAFIKSMKASNGYQSDEHELFMLPDSGYFLIGRRETTVDMSQYVTGGQTGATVRETCIQEFTADDQMVFIWRAWDHFDIRDLEIEDLTGAYIRFPHMNAICTDDDGHILLSSRHLSEISKIHRQTGAFIWRLSGNPGSPDNDFQFVNDTLNGFRNQHAIQSLGSNRYLLFDNGNLHTPQVSRAVEYEIDTGVMTATLVWEQGTGLSHTYSEYMGNAQRLANGNTHINWAVGDILPIAMEVTPEGEKVFEMGFEKGYHSYRSFRYSWEGKSMAPYLLLEQQADNLTLIFNKFGDTSVDYYNIYGGTSINPTSLMDTSHTTLKQLKDLQNGVGYYFRVSAVDKDGKESEYSNEEEIVVNIVPPGSNLIINGDFTGTLDPWIWELFGSANAEIELIDGVCDFNIEDGGSEVWDVQLRQNNIPLIQGQTYVFEFDAWADGGRIVEIKVGEDVSPFRNYSRIGYTALTTTSKHFTFTFEMQESTDINSRVVINAGMTAQDIHIDNLSLKMDVPVKDEGVFEAQSRRIHISNYPNPFSRSTTISYSIPEQSHISLKVFDGLGREVDELVHEVKSPGNYAVQFDGSKLDNGVYYYRLAAGAYTETKKMLLLH